LSKGYVDKKIHQSKALDVKIIQAKRADLIRPSYTKLEPNKDQKSRFHALIGL